MCPRLAWPNMARTASHSISFCCGATLTTASAGITMSNGYPIPPMTDKWYIVIIKLQTYTWCVCVCVCLCSMMFDVFFQTFRFGTRTMYLQIMFQWFKYIRPSKNPHDCHLLIGESSKWQMHLGAFRNHSWPAQKISPLGSGPSAKSELQSYTSLPCHGADANPNVGTPKGAKAWKLPMGEPRVHPQNFVVTTQHPVAHIESTWVNPIQSFL